MFFLSVNKEKFINILEFISVADEMSHYGLYDLNINYD